MRNILIITVGATPQIVTETIYALLTGANPFIPKEIHLVTTTRAAKVFEPFTRAGNKVEELYAYLGRAGDYVTPSLVPVEDKAGARVRDVRTEAEAVAFGNTATRLISKLADDPRNRIHVSLAGGRKTMGWYAGAALSLFGRDHDQLSHVLVEHKPSDPGAPDEPEALEGCEDFWWPTPHEDAWVTHRYLTDKDGRPKRYNARDGRIDLALIPFVRLRAILSETAFPRGEIDYDAVVVAVSDSLGAYRLRLVIDERAVIAGRHRFQLGHRHFALYALLAKARKNRRPPSAATGLDPSYYSGWLSFHDFGDKSSHYLRDFYDYLAASHRGGDTAEERLAKAVADLRGDYNKFLQKFRTYKSEIDGPSGAFMDNLPNPMIRDRIGVKTLDNATGLTCFGLLLEPGQIEIVESE